MKTTNAKYLNVDTHIILCKVKKNVITNKWQYRKTIKIPVKQVNREKSEIIQTLEKTYLIYKNKRGSTEPGHLFNRKKDSKTESESKIEM